MTIIPIKWVPWLFLITGLIKISQEDILEGLFMFFVGVAWLILRNRNKAGS